MQAIKAIGITSILLYLWGFLFWGATTLPYAAWQSTPDDAAAQAALREYFPVSGTYYIPSFDNPPDQLAALFETGPIGFVHINLEGRAQMDPTIMVGGMLLTIAISALMYQFYRATGARSMAQFSKLALLLAVLAVVVFDGGDIVWWQTPLEWKAVQALYNFSLWAIGGHLLGFFMKEASDD